MTSKAHNFFFHYPFLQKMKLIFWKIVEKYNKNVFFQLFFHSPSNEKDPQNIWCLVYYFFFTNGQMVIFFFFLSNRGSVTSK